MLSIIQPLTNILGPVTVSILAVTISHIIAEMTLIEVSVRMDKSARTLSLILLEPTFI